MDSLVLHLSGPLQSWGVSGRFDLRDTYSVPTKSALVGLLAACEGRPRGADVADLAALEVAVRVDRPGIAVRDYHTVGAPDRRGPRLRNAKGRRRSDAVITDRWYLAGAAFTVAFGGEPDLVDACHRAVRAPRFAPFLGRRCCVPDAGWVVGVLCGVDARTALTERVPLVAPEDPSAVRVVADDPNGAVAEVSDLPVGPLDRRYGRRRVSDAVVDLSHLPVVTDSIELFDVVAEGAGCG